MRTRTTDSRTDHPAAPRDAVVETIHGHRIADPYRWLEDAADPRTVGWLAGQDALWRGHADALPDRDRFARLIEDAAAVGAVSAPRMRGERSFVLRQEPGAQHPVLYLRTPDGERVLLDPMAVDPSGLSTLDAFQPDRTGRLLAYQISRGGTENAVLSVLAVDDGTVVDGPVPGCRYSPVAWLPDGSGFYYVRTRTGHGTERAVYSHRLGGPYQRDEEILHAPGAAYGIDLGADGHTLLLAASRSGAPGTDLWLADTAAPTRHRPVHTGLPASTTGTLGADGLLYLLTDHDAPRRRLCVADPCTPAPEHWQELLAEDTEAVLTDVALLDDPGLPRPVLLATRTRHAVAELTAHDPATGAVLSRVPLPGPGTLGPLGTDPTAARHAWFSYQDWVTPPTVHRYDAATGRLHVVARPPGARTGPVPCTRRMHAVSADGTPVPATVISAATDEPDGQLRPRPTVLYGYGGFGVPLTPAYSSHIHAWVRAGGVFVTANLRGGGEGGAAWHRAGTLGGKQRVVEDVLAVARLLIAEGGASPGTLGLTGESNGGLVMAAALTQHPELFAAAVCSAAVLDMVRYERFGTGASWRAEYGSAADPDALAALLGYSPYHRVTAGTAYPAVLLTAFAADRRVDPAHARKMCAALQHASTSGRPVLLRHEADAGHGARAAHRATRLSADMLAFLAAHTTGVTP